MPDLGCVMKGYLQLSVLLGIETHWLYGCNNHNHAQCYWHKQHDHMLCSIFQGQFFLLIIQGNMSHASSFGIRRISIGSFVKAVAATRAPFLRGKHAIGISGQQFLGQTCPLMGHYPVADNPKIPCPNVLPKCGQKWKRQKESKIGNKKVWEAVEWH